MISEKISRIIKNSIFSLQKKKKFPSFKIPEIKIEIPERKEHGDFSTSLPFQISKIIKKNPSKIAKEISKEISLQKEKFLEKIEVSKEGFINFFLSKKFLIEELKKILRKKENYGKSKIGKGKTILVDYSAPNVAKKFGIGHLRSTIVGEAICKIFKSLGYKVISINHLGDWGTQFGNLIYQIRKKKINLKKITLEKMENLYVEFHQIAEKDPKIKEEGRKWFEKLERGDKEARKIWKVCIEKSLQEFKKIYSLLGIKIDFTLGESFYEKLSKKIIEEIKEKRIARESRGALVVEFEKLPPAILLKNDGTTTYFTRDLAAIKYRLERWNPYLIVYEVGAEQSLYFKQLFKTVEMLGWAEKERFYHLAHGLYIWKRKKFSTRKGATIHLEEVIKEAIDRAKKIIEKSEASKNLSQKEKIKIAKIVGIGAIKYNDLKHHPSTDIVFQWEKVLNLKGNSAPYLQYTFVRCKSLIKKSKFKNKEIELKIVEDLKEIELEILKVLLTFPEIVKKSAQTFSPNLISNFIFDLAQKYNFFYEKLPILKEKSKKKRDFRLALTKAVGQIIKNSLFLLGISVPQRM